MSKHAAKVLQYVISGYSITSVTRDQDNRVLKLQAPILKLYAPAIKLSEADYRATMQTLVEYLLKGYVNGERIDVQTSHYGQEWVEIRDASGRIKNKLALSSRTIHALKERMASCAPAPSDQDIPLASRTG